jgi:23S rRNA (cytidine1920-2'-O)/16S rRNA (cytidine1409-2'-O)-methyltransferase
VGKGQVGKGGIVRDAAKQRGTVIGIRKFAADAGFDVGADFPSPVPGAKGNREFFLHLRSVPV